MAKNTASIPAKITGSTYSAAEFEILRGFVDVPIQTLGIFDGALIELSGTGDYTDKTLAAHTEITFAESAHERGNVHFVQITTPGGYTVTLTKPSAYGLTYPDAFTNGGILAAGVYDFAFAFISGKIKVKFEAITVDGGDVTAPTMTSRTIENAAPTDMVMVFDEVVTGTNLGFTIAGTTSTAFASISGSGTNTITGTMAVAAVFGETITLDYSSVTGDIVDGNSNALVTFSGAAVTNNVADATAPTMTSATIENATDSVLDFIFSDAVTITTAGWNIDTDGAALSISSVLSGSGTTTPKFQLSRSVLSTETLNVDYDSTTGNTVKVSNSVELVTFTDTAVTNNVAGASIIILEDNFNDNSFDTGKWKYLNDDGTLTKEQNQRLELDSTLSTGGAESLSQFTESIYAVSFIPTKSSGSTSESAGFVGGLTAGTTYDSSNRIAIVSHSSNRTLIRTRLVDGGVSILNDDSTVALGSRIKIVYNYGTGAVTYSWWDTGSWTQFDSAAGVDIGNTITAMLIKSVSAVDDMYYDDFYLSDSDYATELPT